MDRLLRDLVEYARAGSAGLRHERVDLGLLARSAFADVAPGKVELTFAAPGMQQKKIAATEVVEGKDLDGLEAAFRHGGWREVRSLRRDAVDPARCWYAGKGWALCYDPPAERVGSRR